MLGTIIFTLAIVVCLAFLIFRLFVYRGGRGIEFRDPLSLIVWPPQAEVQAQPYPNNAVEISWEQPSALKIDAQTIANGKKETLATLMGESKFVHEKSDKLQREIYTVTFKNGRSLSAALRFWELPNIINLRDLGGYKTVSGEITAWGKIYRTGHLGGVNEETVKVLEQHQIKLVCDLRSYRERSENPDQVPANTVLLETSIYEDDQLSAIFPKLLFNRASLGDQLGAGYIRMLDERPEQFAKIIDLITHNFPAMFHCTAGKDRAGITSALILSLLDVPRETIIADYSLSNLVSDALYDDFMGSSASTIERFGIPPEQLKPLFVADPQWMINALEHLDSMYGGVATYLIERGRLEPNTIGKLRKGMLV